MTNVLVWKEDWITGIPEIDQTHRAMADKLNQLIELVNQTSARTEPCRKSFKLMLSELQTLTRKHFVLEEKTMLQHNFPDFASHKKEHAILLAEMSQLIREIGEKGVPPDDNTQRNLKHWFIAHMVIADKAFANYFHTLQPA